MTKIWQQLFKRQFEVERPDGTKVVMTTSRKEYFEMLNSMFRVMVSGISNDISKNIEALRKEKKSNLEIFEQLNLRMYDPNEQRLQLWLLLPQNEKLDMMLHQRVDIEMKIMLYLVDMEYNFQENPGVSEKLDIKLERSLDSQIYSKYQLFARFQAITKSLQMCEKRLSQVVDEDRSLLEYAAFLREKQEEYESIMNQMQSEVSISQRKNEKLTKVIQEHGSELKQIKRQGLLARTKRVGINVIAEESYKGSKMSQVVKD